MVELRFEDDFVPPKYFEDPECKMCPLHSWNDDFGILDCHFCGEWEEEGEKIICPIKKYLAEKNPMETAEIVRCKNCEYCNPFGECSHPMMCSDDRDAFVMVNEDDFCSYGKRK
jgi:hypothetical protein